MPIFEQFPYTNLHELNLDWLIAEMKKTSEDMSKIEDFVYNKIDEAVTQYVQENLSQFILGAMYDEENTAILLRSSSTIDGDHVYLPESERIVVLEGR